MDPQFIFSFRRSDFAKADVLSLGVLIRFCVSRDLSSSLFSSEVVSPFDAE